jgi:hypothetical protein
MPVSLEFDNTHRYTEATDSINVPITLALGANRSIFWRNWMPAPRIAFLSASTPRSSDWKLNPAGFSVFGRIPRDGDQRSELMSITIPK